MYFRAYVHNEDMLIFLFRRLYVILYLEDAYEEDIINTIHKKLLINVCIFFPF